MYAIAALLTLAGAVPQTELAKQSRAFFSKAIDFKVKGDLLLVETDPKGIGGSGVYQLAHSSFPGAGRVYVRWQGGSSSRSGGGGPTVNIQFEPSGNAGTYRFELQAPGGAESVLLEQQGTGQFRFELRRSSVRVSYAQAKGSCALRVRAPDESYATRARTFSGVLEDCPDSIRRYFLESLEAYFDKVPFAGFAAAPPGKTLLRLRDGSVIVGDVRLSELRVRTDYGVLTLPRDDLRQVVFPESGVPEGDRGGAAGPARESLVVARRFSPRGVVDLEAFDMVLPYGELRVSASDVREAVFGPPGESSGASRGEG